MRRILLVVPVLIAAAAAVVVVTGNPFEGGEPAPEPERCNGSVRLCSRALDDVAMAATHNSMSAADQPGWRFTQQEKGIPAQLEAGIHGLLIDMYYGAPTSRGVQNVPRREVGRRSGDVYLCHSLCTFGATRAIDAMRDVRDFLTAHLREVIVISIEDHVRPQDVARVVTDSGLIRYVWPRQLDPDRLPTLARMIATGGRALMMAENDRGDVAWLQDQFEVVQETPFRFESIHQVESAGSCRPNRGDSGNPLFLLNNWVDTSPFPQPRNAAVVNSYPVLLSRARRCQSERGRMPNLVAVDFYEEGDVRRVVDDLNR